VRSNVSSDGTRRRLRVHVKLRGIPNKRQYLARTLERLGALGLLECVVAMRRPALVVLTYHRIAESGNDRYYDPVISAAPQSFRAQVGWLHDRMPVLTLRELDDRIQAGATWTKPAALVTFDDGYRDNFDVALPILRELDIPATFFIPTRFLESPKLPWWDHVAYVIKQTSRHRLEIKLSPNGQSRPLLIELDRDSRDAAIATIIRAILDNSITDLTWFLEELTAQTEIAIDSESLGRALFMSWEQVRHLADTGDCFAIGSHAHSHQDLAKLDTESQQRELVLSKEILEKRLEREVLALAYPFGWCGSYTQATKILAQEAGYRVAFSSRAGLNQPSTLDPLEISRLSIGSGDSLALLRARTALFSAFGGSFL
jgi:peptidoglycan/xylan/chitin deacetylase (PgdA/CDA1 family)